MSIPLNLASQGIATVLHTLAIPATIMATSLVTSTLVAIPAIAIAKAFDCWSLYRLSQDSNERHGQNLKDLQALNTQTTPLINDFTEVPKALALAHVHFAPALQSAEKLLTTHINETLPMQEAQVQALVTAQQKIDLPEFESSIEYFMGELARMQSIHSDDILDYVQIIPEMQKAAKQLKTAQNHLQEAKQELDETLEQQKTTLGHLQEANQELDENIQEYNELKRRVLEANYQRNEALRLKQQAEPLIEKGNPSSHQIQQGASNDF